MSRVRLSPSGKVLETIGAGAQLRFVEARSSVSGGSQVITTSPASVGFVLGSAPALDVGFTTGTSPNENYRATMCLDVNNTSNVSANVELDLFVDWGDGNGFNSVAKSSHVVSPGTARHIRVDCPPTIPPAAMTKAVFEGRISNDLDGVHVNVLSSLTGPTIDFQVSELQSS